MRILITIMFLTSACSTRHRLIGTWKAGNYSLYQKGIAILNSSELETANTLTLKNDFSFRLEGSCEITEGNTWTIDMDSLFLYPDTSWLKNPTPDHFSSPQIIKGNFLAYKIKRRKLERHCTAFPSGEEQKKKLHPRDLYEILKPQ